ncbi:Amino-acid permease BAT1 homolog [Linum perenne]
MEHHHQVPEFREIQEMDSGEKRLNELGYKQELRRQMTLFKTLAISFSTMTLFTGITPLYGSSLMYAGPATLVWGWVVVSFFTSFVGIAMAEICSSFPTTGSLYFWAAHLAGPKWGPFASWCCAWLETIGLVAGIGTQAFHGRYQNSAGAIILLFVIWGSFFFGGLSITTSAARVVYALSRDKGLPFSSVWSKIHPKHKVPSNAVWLCAAICILLGLPILKVNVVFTAITSICTIGWVGGYAVPIFARMVMDEKKFKAGPFYLGKARRPVCFVAFIWICYTCCVFLLPTMYPITWDTFNYAPVALGIGLGLIMLWWVLDARKWFKGPVRNIDAPNGHKV